MFIGCAFTPPITGLIAKYILTESRQFAHYSIKHSLSLLRVGFAGVTYTAARGCFPGFLNIVSVDRS